EKGTSSPGLRRGLLLGNKSPKRERRDRRRKKGHSAFSAGGFWYLPAVMMKKQNVPFFTAKR
ncbi:MAG: hypothetical protein ACKO6B_07340, partial [Planctomycetia bacterium]